tara:strand:- start:24 stop:443 length:420 start_codon:yes stop_codon:yes gene_type:complete
MKTLITEETEFSNLNDSLNIDIKEEKKEECVICFEIVDEDIEDFKFDCEHKKYMHTNCIRTLVKCPICRTRVSREEDLIIVNLVSNNNHQWFACILFTGFCVFLFLLSFYPMTMMTSFGRYNNSTSIVNMTNITSDIIL